MAIKITDKERIDWLSKRLLSDGLEFEDSRGYIDNLCTKNLRKSIDKQIRYEGKTK